MKKVLASLTLSLTFALLGITAHAQHSKVDSILNLHFEKAGGKEAWKRLNTYILTQSGYQVSISPHSITDYAQNEKVKESPRVTYYQYPDKYRTEYFTDGQKDFMGLITASEAKVYFISGDADSGSGITLPEDLHKEVLNGLPFHSIGPTHFILLKKAEKEMEYKGLVEAYGKNCHQLVFTDKNLFNSKINLYSDAETYLIHAMSSEEHPQWHKIYADYWNEDGIIIPHTITGYKEGKLIERYKTSQIKIDEVLDGNIFLRR